jgi:hypothetical protein
MNFSAVIVPGNAQSNREHGDAGGNCEKQLRRPVFFTSISRLENPPRPVRELLDIMWRV